MPLPVTAMMKRRLFAVLEDLQGGRLVLTTPEGTVHTFGAGGEEVDLRINDWALLPRLLARGDIGLGEAYIDGMWDTTSLEGVLALALNNLEHLGSYAQGGWLGRLWFQLSDKVFRANSLRGASRNIRAHYDVGNEFYHLWLDPGMTYSSALFADGETDLERAQARKNDRILSRLAEGGETILEIGCGWGGFAERAADRGHRVTGLTLSPSQKAYADARLDGRADIRLEDYRKVEGQFANIVSIEMIEAVGERYWPAYFAALKARLAEGGHAVIQAITVPDSEFSVYRTKSDFIRQHTFPGGMLPCHAAMVHEAGKAGLVLRDTFTFGLDYARTCRTWAQRMMAEQKRIAALGYGKPFLRNWRFYLEASAATFATRRTDVTQLTFAHA